MDFLAKRDADLANAEGALLTVYQQLEEKRHEAAVLKSALNEEQMQRTRSENELSDRKLEMQTLETKYRDVQEKLAFAKERIKAQKASIPDAATLASLEKARKEQEVAFKMREKNLLEKCRRLEQRLSEEKTKRKEAEKANPNEGDSARSGGSAKENVPADVDDLKLQSEALHMQVNLCKDELSARDSTIQALERRCRRLEEKKVKAEAETVESEGYVLELERKIEELMEDLDDTKRTGERVSRTTKEAFQAEKEELLDKLGSAMEEKQDLQSQVEILKQRVLDMEKKLADAEVHSEEVDKLHDSNEKASRELEFAQCELERVRGEWSESEKKALDLASKCEELETLIDGDDSSGQEGERALMRYLRQKNKSLTEQVNALKAKVEEAVKPNEPFQAESPSGEEGLALKSKAEELSKALAALNESKMSVEELAVRNRQLEKYLEETRETAIDLQARLSEKEFAIEEHAKESAASKLEAEKLKLELDRLKIEMERSELRLATAQEALSRLDSQRDDEASEVDHIMDQLEQSESSNKKLQQELEFARLQIDRLQEKNRSQKDDASSALEERTQSLQRMSSRHKILQEELEAANQKIVDLERDLEKRAKRSSFLNAESVRQHRIDAEREKNDKLKRREKLKEKRAKSHMRANPDGWGIDGEFSLKEHLLEDRMEKQFGFGEDRPARSNTSASKKNTNFEITPKFPTPDGHRRGGDEDRIRRKQSEDRRFFVDSTNRNSSVRRLERDHGTPARSSSRRRGTKAARSGSKSEMSYTGPPIPVQIQVVQSKDEDEEGMEDIISQALSGPYDGRFTKM